MKKNLVFVLLLFIIAFAVHSQAGVIIEIKGDVALKPAGTSYFFPAYVGSYVEHDTIISTGFKSTAVIDAGSSLITLQPLTRISLYEIQDSTGAENLNVNLETGRIRVDIKPSNGATAVKSSGATALARGASLEMDTHRIVVTEGNVVFSGKDRIPVVVSNGSSSTITARDSALNPSVIAAASLKPPDIPGASASGGVPDNTTEMAALKGSADGVGFVLDW